MNEKAPWQEGSDWFVFRDPDERSYYAADLTSELIDRATSPKANGALELVLVGVVQLEMPQLQVVTVAGVQRTYAIAFLGGVGGDPPADWKWTARVSCANGERFDKTTNFRLRNT